MASKTEDFLEHYGVKGMRWGVRKQRSSSKGKAPKKESPSSADTKSVREIRRQARTGGVKSLTNKQLQESINRKNLEKQFKQMQRESSKTYAGRKFVTNTMKEVGGNVLKTQLTRGLNTFAGHKVDKFMADRFDLVVPKSIKRASKS